MGLYESHVYPADPIITSGKAEAVVRHFREEVNALDPNGLNVPYLLGESGTGDWPGKGVDSNTHIRQFFYGVQMADYLVQSGHAGLAGQSAWMLDDSMHNQDHELQIKGVTTGDPKVDDNLKEWGMWNIMGASMGKPDEENPRPWYSAWALASRCFPRGCTILSTGAAPFDDARVGAALVRHGDDADLGMIVVNDSDTRPENSCHRAQRLGNGLAATIRLFRPGSPGRCERPPDGQADPAGGGSGLGTRPRSADPRRHFPDHDEWRHAPGAQDGGEVGSRGTFVRSGAAALCAEQSANGRNPGPLTEETATPAGQRSRHRADGLPSSRRRPRRPGPARKKC